MGAEQKAALFVVIWIDVITLPEAVSAKDHSALEESLLGSAEASFHKDITQRRRMAPPRPARRNDTFTDFV